ncbi:MAG: molybdate ABC transporter substrate-binding protein [Nitrospiraceae bacterium]
MNVEKATPSLLAILAVVMVGVLVLGVGSLASASGEELTIAAASDLNSAFKELVTEFEKASGTHVKLSLGSSGNFFSQIQHGAPYDLYFSADIRYPQKLIQTDHALADSLHKYAVGRIVVWVSNSSPVAVDKLGMDSLLNPSIRKIAIANPKHAPYGRAAVASMEHFNLYERIKEKIVLGENVSQAAQFVESGAADIGIVALSLALSPTMRSAGKYWEIPESAHQPLEQGAVIVKTARNPDGAKSFLKFLQGSEGRKVMASYGFVAPE